MAQISTPCFNIINLPIDIINIFIENIKQDDKWNGGFEMNRHVPTSCPSCAETMHITELTCSQCGTRVQGDFATSGFWRLSPEQLAFAEVFLRCRGNIKEVERDLKISYPTVRTKLDHVIRSLGYDVPADDSSNQHMDALIDGLRSGELTFEQALDIVKEGKHHE